MPKSKMKMKMKRKIPDTEIKKLHAQGLSDSEIAGLTGLTRTGVRYRRLKLNLRPNDKKGRRQKVSDRELIRLHSRGLTDGEMAEATGYSKDHLAVRRRKLGLKPNIRKRGRESKVDRDAVRCLHYRGLTTAEIADKLGCCPDTVRKVRQELNLVDDAKTHSEKISRGKKLDNSYIEMIRDLNQAGFNDPEIAGILGISQTTVRKYRIKMGLEPVGVTCCSYDGRVKHPDLKRRIEMCGDATQEFLKRYFEDRKRKKIGGES